MRAEHARTVLHTAPVVEVTVGHAVELVVTHGADQFGRPLLVVATGSALASTGGPAPFSLVAARVHDVPAAQRLRDRIELHGLLDVVPARERRGALARLVAQRRWPAREDLPATSAILRGEPLAVAVDGCAVDPEEYRAARPDPLADAEPALLRALRAEPGHLAALLGPPDADPCDADPCAVAPIGVDRYGVTVRVSDRHGVRESRIPFPAPVGDADEATVALWLLAARARFRSDGPRPAR